MKATTRESITALSFLLPFLVALVVFFAFAFLRTVYFSFTDYDLFKTPNFVGIDNFVQVPTDPLFLTALTNTFAFSITVTVLQTIGALLLAVVLNQRLRGITFFRTAYYFPSIASSAVTALIFIWLFRPTGLVSFIGNWLGNHALVILGFVIIVALLQTLQFLFERSRKLPVTPMDPALLLVSVVVGLLVTLVLTGFRILPVGTAEVQPLNWLSSREKFLGLIPLPLMVIIFQNTFTTIPSLMLTFLAGLQGISKSLYEAASIDGASPLQQMRSITIPMLRPVMFYVITVSLIGTLQMFDQVALLEGTAPLESTITLAFYVFNRVFSGGGASLVGQASAAALILAGLTLLVVQLQRRFFVSDEGAGK
jgi:multiple sugar transport system permease protein